MSAAHFNLSSIQRADGEDGGASQVAWYFANLASFGAANYPATRTGWTDGGGGEWMFLDKCSARTEALYYNRGTVSLTSTPMAMVCTGCESAGGDIPPGGLLWAASPVTKVQFDG